MQNHTLDPYVAPVFSPPSYAVAVNALMFSSLGVVLIAAFLCMLVKGWIRELDRKLRGIPDLQKRAVIKELREQGLVRWRLPEMITILPSLIHLALALFFIGLALYLLQVNKLPAFLLISIFGLGMLLYVLSIAISAVDDFSPFRSLYSRTLGVLYRRLYFRLLSPFVYRQPSLMALPQTAAEKIREWVSRFIGAYEPFSEQAVLDAQCSSSKQLIARTSVPVLNKLWNSVGRGDTSMYAKVISTSILLQLDDLNIRPPRDWFLGRLYEISSLSVKEAECLVYSICTQRRLPVSPRFWETVCASLQLLEQRLDPWLRLITLLIRSKIGVGDSDMLKSRIPTDRNGSVWYIWSNPNASPREAEILQAISDVKLFSEEQWCFVLSVISTLFVKHKPNDIPACARILARLLQSRVVLDQPSHKRADEHIDFWLHVMMTLLEKCDTSDSFSLHEEVQYARDIETYGIGNLRNPNYIRQLLRLSQDHSLDPSLMRGCLVTILYILILNGPMNRQQIRLVNQYLNIIGEEMDIIAWSISLAELPSDFCTGPYLQCAVSCLLSGRCLPVPDQGGPTNNECVAVILREFDLKLTAAGSQPTTSILKVVAELSWDRSWVTRPELQNAWLSLYVDNLARSSYTSGIPDVWSPDCTPIASKRLDLYDDATVPPEMNIIIFFLSSHSCSIACRALRWYLRLSENGPIANVTGHFIAFPTIFCKGLSVDENRESWLTFISTLFPVYERMSPEGRLNFTEAFFGFSSLQAKNHVVAGQRTLPAGEADETGSDLLLKTESVSTAQADGLGWMEEVWMTALRGHIVHLERVHTPWPAPPDFVHATYSGPTRETQLASLSLSSGQHEGPEGPTPPIPAAIGPKTMEEHLKDSARWTLKVLAQLLEAGADSMPAILLDRVRNSSLLSDERLHYDTDSLHRIQATLNCTQEN